MNLVELRYGCRLYGQLTTYDASLQRFRERVAPALDPWRPEHRASLFEWLNSWGCRQFALEHHTTTASESLITWANLWLSRLPSLNTHLTDLTATEIRECAAAYDALRRATASQRTLSDGRRAQVTFGPTGAAKTLFALRPNVVPPWDSPIRVSLGFSGDLGSFRVYLTRVAAQLQALALEADAPVSKLPSLVGRPDSSAPKLIDEYNWVVITKGLIPPTGGQARVLGNPNGSPH